MITTLTIVSSRQGRVFGDRADMREVERHAERVGDVMQAGAEAVSAAKCLSRRVQVLLWLGLTHRPAIEKA